MLVWLKKGISFILLILLLGFIGSIFRSYPLLFFIVWILLPIAALIGTHKSILQRFNRKGVTLFRIILISTAIFIAFLVFANYEYFRDNYGESKIQGYHVSYNKDVDVDTFGRSISSSTVHTQNIGGKILLWFYEWIYIGFCFGIPILTWKLTSITVEKWEDMVLYYE